MKNRRERLICFLVVWLTMFSCIQGKGQSFYPVDKKTAFSGIQYPGNPAARAGQKFPVIVQNRAEKAKFSAFYPLNSYKIGVIGQIAGIYAQPADLYYLQSGFFCKKEWELEKTTHIPFRFRLGSLADCNALEGKH
jgi:hypothetical protein